MLKMTTRVLYALVIVSAALQANEDMESRVRRVEKGLLPPVLVQGESGWTLEERMRDLKVPGVSIAVFHDFKIEWVRAYGLKDIETRDKVTPETLFQAGSISKPVAAMVALKKVEEGKLSLEESINFKLTSWKLPDNEFTSKKKVSLANLLSHTGGLTVHGFPGYGPGASLPSLIQVLDGSPPANTAAVRVNMEPGVKFRYSGGGTTIMQLALMDIEKQPFPRIARETVLAPLQMTRSTYEQPLPAVMLINAASGHRSDGSLVPGKSHVYPEMAAAGLWTTPGDLAKFAIEIQLSLAGKSNKVLSRTMIDRMLTPFIDDNVGLGFFLDRKGTAVYFQHGGADEGFRAQLMAHKEKGYGAVVMVNSDNGQILGEILRGIAREYNWESYLPEPHTIVSVAPGILDAYAGSYLVDPDTLVRVSHSAGKLLAEPTQLPRFELLPISENRFIRRESAQQVTFHKNDKGEVESASLEAEGEKIRAARVPDPFKIPADYLMTGEHDRAIEEYRRIRREHPNNAAVSERRLNTLGYRLMRSKHNRAAIVVFRINAEFYPESSNVHDSLGEGYLALGEKQLAIQSYRRSLELDPGNANARQMLKKLQGETP